MNKHKINMLQHLSLVKPDSNYFIYHQNSAYTSKRGKQNRVNALLLQKLILLQKHYQVGEIIHMLLRSLTQQYFYENYTGDSELREELLYYNGLLYQNPAIYDIFSHANTPHKQKFQLWLDKLCHFDDQQIQQNLELLQFDTEYLNTPKYQILIAIANQSFINLSFVQNGHILIKSIAHHNMNDQYQQLKSYKDNYMPDVYVIKKRHFQIAQQLEQPINLQDVNRISSIDLYDSSFQILIVQTYLNMGYTDLAMNQLCQHLLNAVVTDLGIWQLLLFTLNAIDQSKLSKLELDFIKQKYFLYDFLIEILNPIDEVLIRCKLQFLEYIDKDLYYNYLEYV